VAKIWKCTYTYTQSGESCALGLHYQWDGDTGSDEPGPDDLATRLDSHLRSAMRNMLGNTTGSLTALIVREEVDPSSDDVPAVHELLIGLAGTGVDPDGDQPKEVVPLFHRKTAGAVKGGQSWCFGPAPYGAASIVGGLWDTGSIVYGFWTAFAALLDDDIDHAGSIPGISGTYHPVAYAKTRRRRGVEPYTFQVTSASVDRRPRWLRSRNG